jgi:aspartate carbamoyltransferase catalytic subunit
MTYILFINYRTHNFTKINNTLSIQRLNREHSCVTQKKQQLPVNKKVKTHSNTQVQNILKVNFFLIKSERSKTSISNKTSWLTKKSLLLGLCTQSTNKPGIIFDTKLAAVGFRTRIWKHKKHWSKQSVSTTTYFQCLHWISVSVN